MDASSPHPFRTVGWFVVIATLACLAVASPAILGAVPVEAAGLLVPVAQLTPLLVAVGFFVTRRRDRFASVFAVGRGRSWPAIGCGLTAVVAIGLVQLGVTLLSGVPVQRNGLIAAAAVAVPVVLAMQCIFAIGEELGWRGWLITQIQTLPFWQISAVSSVAWVVWHLPALPLVVGDGGWQHGAAYLLAIASWAPFMVALRLWSGSVWPAVVVHGALNSIRVFLTQSVVAVEGVVWAAEIGAAILWLGLAAVLHSRRGRRGEQ